MSVRTLLRSSSVLLVAAILAAPLALQQGYTGQACPQGLEKVVNTGECVSGPVGPIVRNKVGKLMNINRCATYKERASDESIYHQSNPNLAGGQLTAAQAALTAENYDVGDIAVLVDNRNSIISEDALGTRIDLVAAAQQYMETHSDNKDFLIFYPDFNHAEGSYHIHVKNDVQGIGVPIQDDSAIYGTQYLKSLVLMRNFTGWPDVVVDANGVIDPASELTRIPGNNDSPMSLLAQETGHRWGAWVKADKNLGTKKRAQADSFLLGRNEAHWCFYTSGPATGPSSTWNGFSSMEGNYWLDNLDGTYTTVGRSDGYSQIDQYLQGFRSPGQVDPFVRLDTGNGKVTPDCSNRPFTPGEDTPWTVSYPPLTIHVDDITRVEGMRVPDAGTSQKNYRVAFVLLAKAGTTPSAGEISKLDAYRRAWEGYFRDETVQGRMFTALGPVDMDSDGYLSNVDCDDGDSDVYPGQVEVCNNVDDDCDGVIDEDFDADGDLYTSCNGDCDDSNFSMNPGAVEIWDGLDDNCDGTIDNVNLVDNDGDGYYANPSDPLQADCNDYDPAVSPGAIELVNGIDDNCNNYVDCEDPTVVPETDSGPRGSDGLDNDCNGVIDG